MDAVVGCVLFGCYEYLVALKCFEALDQELKPINTEQGLKTCQSNPIKQIYSFHA